MGVACGFRLGAADELFIVHWPGRHSCVPCYFPHFVFGGRLRSLHVLDDQRCLALGLTGRVETQEDHQNKQGKDWQFYLLD